MTGSESTTVSTNKTLVTYDCSYMTLFMWNLNDDDTNADIAFIITCASCPLIILFNTIIIVVVAKKPSLQTNSQILLSSLAVADLVVGAVFQPLTIIIGAFGTYDDNLPVFLCTLDLINVFVLYSVCWCSLCHLTAIAWERKARISENLNYATNVSRKRIKQLIFASWMSLLLFLAPGLMYFAGVKETYVIILDITITILPVVVLVLIVYYYISIFIKTREVVIHPTNENISPIAMAKYEKQIAVTTALLTLVLLICYLPAIVVYIVGYVFPVLHANSFIYWSMALIELNSLANPLLYCFRNRQIRKAIIELLCCCTMPVVRRNAIPSHNDDIPLDDLRLPHVQN